MPEFFSSLAFAISTSAILIFSSSFLICSRSAAYLASPFLMFAFSLADMQSNCSFNVRIVLWADFSLIYL